MSQVTLGVTVVKYDATSVSRRESVIMSKFARHQSKVWWKFSFTIITNRELTGRLGRLEFYFSYNFLLLSLLTQVFMRSHWLIPLGQILTSQSFLYMHETQQTKVSVCSWGRIFYSFRRFSRPRVATPLARRSWVRCSFSKPKLLPARTKLPRRNPSQ